MDLDTDSITASQEISVQSVSTILASHCPSLTFEDALNEIPQHIVEDFLQHKQEMFQRLHKKPGRNHKSTFDATERPSKEQTPPGFEIWDYSCIPIESESEKVPLKVVQVDYNVASNIVAHHTDVFEITRTRSELDPLPRLVVRRGQPFFISVWFNRPFSNETEEVQLTFQFGEEATVSRGSRVTVNLNKGIKPHNWSARASKVEETKVLIEVLTPADCIVGKCSLTVDTKKTKTINRKKKKDATPPPPHADGEETPEKTIWLRYLHNDPIYILFNPWQKEDQVYMADAQLRDECVLSEIGELYAGNCNQVVTIPWNFAQFENVVLDCCLYFLDATHLKHTARGNAVMVVRNIAMLMNSSDDHGVLVGDWSGQYREGTAPTQWLGSLAILEEFWSTKLPVRYGQCWVFAAVATTVCRCLGIPTRCVTNYSSAHDCDGTNTINLHWNFQGEPIESMNSESIWSFHVWNESFMLRPDLPGSVGGWQAFDPTPQEASDGVYCGGPCSIEAIRRGEIFLHYDGALLFSELNTNRFHWVLQKDGSWRTILQKNVTGNSVITRASAGESVVDASVDYRDLTSEYKFNEGSEEERASLLRANTWATNAGVFDKGDGDVKFIINQNPDIMAGSAFDVALQLQNKSRFERTVRVTLTLLSTYYTGLTRAKIKTESFDVTLCSLKSQLVSMRVLAEDYAYSLTDQVTFQICALARVTETDQLFVDCVDFCLVRPMLEIEVPDSVKIGEKFDCVVKLFSQMPIDLSDCEWMVESVGLIQAIKSPQTNLEPYAKVQIKVPVTPQRLGRFVIMASFNSKQLMGVTGTKDVTVLLNKSDD